MTTPRPRTSLLRQAIVMGIVLVVSLVVGLAPTPVEGSSRALTAGWQYQVTDLADLGPLSQPADAPGWTSIAMPAHPPRVDGEVLWLRTRLPDLRLRDPAIAIDAVIGPFEAFVDGARVHAHPAPDGLASTRIPGVPWQLISLPEGSEGRLFSLRVRSDGRSALVRGTPVYGERADQIASALKRDAVRLACGLLVILIGIAGFVIFARKDDWRVPCGFMAWSGGVGLYVVHYTHAKDVLFDAPHFWFVVWLVALPSIPLGGMLFVSGVFGAGPRRIIDRLVRLLAVYLPAILAIDVVCAALYASHRHLATVLFTIPLVGLRVLYLVTSVAAVIVVGRRAREGSPEARIFLFGLFGSVAFTMNDLLASAGVAGLSWKSLTHWGALMNTIALAFILQRRYGQALERAAAFAAEVRMREREKESLLRDLHDGVGGLTSNIRMLAELGQKSDERAKRSLSTIAELSEKSLAQLRAFVQALDDTTTTWESLAAELQRFGTHLLSAAGVELEIETDLRTRDLPRSLLSIHVLRVFQECVTNALKHRVTKVEIVLRADDTRMELVVRSDGRDGAPSAKPGTMGIDLGRGLANMRARAAELGGTFTMTPGPPTEVRLFVPLPFYVPFRTTAPPREGLPEEPPDQDAGDSLAS